MGEASLPTTPGRVVSPLCLRAFPKVLSSVTHSQDLPQRYRSLRNRLHHQRRWEHCSPASRARCQPCCTCITRNVSGHVASLPLGHTASASQRFFFFCFLFFSDSTAPPSQQLRVSQPPVLCASGQQPSAQRLHFVFFCFGFFGLEICPRGPRSGAPIVVTPSPSPHGDSGSYIASSGDVELLSTRPRIRMQP